MKQYALIGKSLAHSFSKDFFTAYFKQEHINAAYSNLELSTIEEFVNFRNRFDGFNVTIPYKEAIMEFLDEFSDEALEIGAVNTIKVENSKLIGYNTDAFGFHQLIKPFLTNKHERAMILGTGGASKAVDFVLKGLGVSTVFIARNPKRNNEFSYNDINDNMIKACKLIVNCTPVGMYPNSDTLIKLPYDSLGTDHLVVDLIYNPEQTRFLIEAKHSGATTLNGEGMLKAQALKAYELWTT